MNSIPRFCLTVLLGVFPLSAQDQPGEVTKPGAKRLAKIKRELLRISSARNLSFTSSSQMVDMARAAIYISAGRAAPKSAVDRVSGSLVGDILAHQLTEDALLVTRGRRRVGRAGGEWEAILNRLPDSTVLPFLFDPERFGSLLAMEELSVVRQDVGVFEDAPAEIYTLRFSRESAVRLGRAGVFPDGLSGFTRGLTRSMMMASGARRGRGARFDFEETLDVALYLAPGDGSLRHAKIRFSHNNPVARRVRRAGRNGERVAEVVEPVEASEAKPKKLQYKDGLPVRSGEGKILIRLDVTFTEHGRSKLPKLNDTARKLLGLECQ